VRDQATLARHNMIDAQLKSQVAIADGPCLLATGGADGKAVPRAGGKQTHDELVTIAPCHAMTPCVVGAVLTTQPASMILSFVL
jgi:hypothetical protein